MYPKMDGLPMVYNEKKIKIPRKMDDVGPKPRWFFGASHV